MGTPCGLFTLRVNNPGWRVWRRERTGPVGAIQGGAATPHSKKGTPPCLPRIRKCCNSGEVRRHRGRSFRSGYGREVPLAELAGGAALDLVKETAEVLHGGEATLPRDVGHGDIARAEEVLRPFQLRI